MFAVWRVFRRFGLAVPVTLLLVGLLLEVTLNKQRGNGFYSSHLWLMGLNLLLTGIITAVISCIVNPPSRNGGGDSASLLDLSSDGPPHIPPELKCPISLDVMHDPVVLNQSGHTYDKESLCTSLLNLPNLDPLTGVQYDEPLTYVDNVFARNMLMEKLGDDAYRKYDGSEFAARYRTAWARMMEGDQERPAHDQVAELLYGMNSRRIDERRAQELVDGLPQDAITLGIKAMLLDPKCFKSSTLRKDEIGALRTWRLSRERGLQEQARTGKPWAQFLIGRMCECGCGGSNQDYQDAIQWYQMAAGQGHALAQNRIGFMYDEGNGVVQDFRKARKWFEKAAEQGHAGAQLCLGFMHSKGNGVVQDYREARKWYEKAAEQGNAQAQCNIGCMYKIGNGVVKDFREARKWFEKAAEQGHAQAQCGIGEMYCNGYGVVQDDAEAMKWFEKAAEQGYAGAQRNLAIMYDEGNGGTQNYVEAMKWYKMAAEQGDADAQYCIGALYYYGNGVDRDRDAARRWFEKAAEQGDTDAKSMLESM